MLAVFKVAASIIFIWIHSPYNDSVHNKYNFGNNLEYLYNDEIRSDIRFQRSLTNHVLKKDLDSSKVRDRISGNNSYNNIKSTSDDLSKYSRLKKKGLNDLELYKKLYKHRYSKKNVLGKFDCYCEKKIFDQFDYMMNLSEKINMDKKRLKSSFFKKYGSVFIIISLILLLGLIFPVLVYGDKDAIIKICGKDCSEHTAPAGQHINGYHLSSLSKGTLENIFDTYKVLMYVLPLIFFMFIIYIFIKVIKYEKLKAGKSRIYILRININMFNNYLLF
ncbi:hypothetical protein PVBG_05464 [Plasmodium vivax Brazil I]|uniref:Variable surface protein Vir35 n=1 Tax=Plasmodium vivax (strain Brazil I) TaxID=1033975 RepID=A0A0J9SSL9_PLAV1|nr:hypothetical protein PVBG_05464 [Plasmodium vivax Brazil I]